MANTIPFYATATDLISLCETVETGAPLQYVGITTYMSLPIPVFPSYRAIPGFGYAKHGNLLLEDSFLVLRQGEQLSPYPLQTPENEFIYSISPAQHRDALDFRPGGSHGDSTVIQSLLGTFAEKIAADSVYFRFRAQLKARATKIGKYFVAPDALALLRRGGRLTQSVRLPASCDLREKSAS